MKTVIIHKPDRHDREGFVGALLGAFTGAVVQDAYTPEWEEGPARAIRGCACSVLNAVKRHLGDEPLLVLEDDAFLASPMPDLSEIPQGAGIVMLGIGEIAPVKTSAKWERIEERFFGSHAILFMPRLRASDFLLNAFEMASLCSFSPSAKGLKTCMESILLSCASSAGVGIYRPLTFPFSTHASVSDRTGSAFQWPDPIHLSQISP